MANKQTFNTISPKTWNRVGAAVVDFVLGLLLLAVLLLPIGFIIPGVIDSQSSVATLGLVIFALVAGALSSLFAIAYEILLPYLLDGQTIGMRIFRMKFVDEKGEDLKLRQLVIRAVVVVFVFIASFGLSIIAEWFIVLLSEEHRSFNDTISRVYAVQAVKHKTGFEEGRTI